MNSDFACMQVAAENPQLRCNLMFIDGGHTYPIAMSDLVQFAKMADLENGNVIIFDDYPCNKTARSKRLEPVWTQAVQEGFVREVMGCTFNSNSFGMQQSCFSVGVVVKRPK